MKNTIRKQQNFDEFISSMTKAGIRNLPSHLLVVGDTDHMNKMAEYMFRILRQHDLVHTSNPNDYACCSYEFASEIPNDGLQQFYQDLYKRSSGRAALPPVVFLDITSCNDYLNTDEFKTLLSFANMWQRSTVFVFVVDSALITRADKFNKRIERALPISPLYEDEGLSMAV